MKNRNSFTLVAGRRSGMSFVAALACLVACSGTAGTEETAAPQDADEPVYWTEPAASEPVPGRPECYPTVIYDIGGTLVVVPGYCAMRRFGKPVIGDPDPTGLEWLEDAQ